MHVSGPTVCPKVKPKSYHVVQAQTERAGARDIALFQVDLKGRQVLDWLCTKNGGVGIFVDVVLKNISFVLFQTVPVFFFHSFMHFSKPVSGG